MRNGRTRHFIMFANDGAMCPVGITKHGFITLYKTLLDAET